MFILKGIVMKKIYFVRHGQTQANVDGIMSGWSNHPLNEVGILQAKEVAQKFKEEEYRDIERIYSSDLDRAYNTADEINKIIKVEHKVSKNLREVNYGNIEDRSYFKRDEFASSVCKNKDFAYEDFLKKPFNIKYDGGESLYESVQRFSYEMDGIIDKHDSVLVVAHGMILSLWMSYYLFSNPFNYSNFIIDNAKISLIRVYDSGLRRLIYMNK